MRVILKILARPHLDAPTPVGKSIIMTTLLSVLLAFSAYAAQNPPSLCAGMGCTARMEAIAAGFEAAHGIEQSDKPLLASGECYHLTQSLDPNTTHYGVTLLDPHEGGLYMGGEFGFFYPSNPYAAWTAADVRKKDTDMYSANHLVELTPTFAYADMNPGGKSMLLYWIRRDAQHLYVIGQWDTSQRVFCQMDFQ